MTRLQQESPNLLNLDGIIIAAAGLVDEPRHPPRANALLRDEIENRPMLPHWVTIHQCLEPLKAQREPVPIRAVLGVAWRVDGPAAQPLQRLQH
jgi:hypothetical protein